MEIHNYFIFNKKQANICEIHNEYLMGAFLKAAMV